MEEVWRAPCTACRWRHDVLLSCLSPFLQDDPRRREVLQRSGLKSMLALLDNDSGGVQGVCVGGGKAAD